MTTTRSTLTRRSVLLGAAASAGLVATRVRAAFAEPRPPVPTTLPVCFVGHGSPMLAVDATKGREFTNLAASLATPTAVLVVSAHYERMPLTIGATSTRPLLYDFCGFSRSLYEIRYPAPGAPALAKRVNELVSPHGPVRSAPQRGLDHGAWVPLRWMYPKADVPVLPVSLPTHDPRSLFNLGRALRPLRDEGVLILASGNMTHNLRQRLRQGAPTPSWASDFDGWVTATLRRKAVDDLLDWERKAPSARLNHPTVEHFVPLLLAVGASHRSDAVSFPITGYEAGSLSRRCVVFAKPRVG